MNTETDNNETVAVSIHVDEEVIEQVRTGEVTKICLDIDDDNYSQILENVDGHLLLVVDEMPTTFHSCYLYNNGEFPYAIKDSLDFLILEGASSLQASLSPILIPVTIGLVPTVAGCMSICSACTPQSQALSLASPSKSCKLPSPPSIGPKATQANPFPRKSFKKSKSSGECNYCLFQEFKTK